MITRFFSISALMVVACMVAWIPGTTEETYAVENRSDWLGHSYTEVIHALGVPSSMSGGRTGSLEIYYQGSQISNDEPTIRFSGGVVLWVNPNAKLDFKKVSPPSKGAYIGQSVKELVQRLGQPSQFSAGQLSDNAVFPGGLTVSLNNGMVIGTSQR